MPVVSLSLNHSEDTAAIHLLNELLLQAISLQASDIHFEPHEDSYRIRYRIDGLLELIKTIPIDLGHRLTARIKVMAQLDISERRLPQDGRIHFPINPKQTVDLRISVCPTVHSEKVVIRLLKAAISELSIEKLGLEPEQKDQFLQAIQQPQGLILVTGPTGSGKTVTLYTALSHLNQLDKNISTVEDPVEIYLPGINQVAVNPKIGLTFATVLRSLLRQDPDILMVGEIRDKETAEIAIHAALTGHLVFSTLHTNSALQALPRLIQMGVEPFLIKSALSLVVAQRLVRMLASQGYKGRTGIFEMSPGNSSLREAGLKKIEQGITTMDELKRVLGG